MILILSIPVITAVVCYMLKSQKIIGYVSLTGAAALTIFSMPAIVSSISSPIEMMNDMLYMDALSGYIMALVIFLGLASAIYSIGYLEHELNVGLTDITGMSLL